MPWWANFLLGFGVGMTVFFIVMTILLNRFLRDFRLFK